MKKIIYSLVIMGISAQMNSQSIELAEVEVVANYNYIEANDTRTEALAVQKIQAEVNAYKCRNQDIDENGEIAYTIFFDNMSGQVTAEYNIKGHILSTTEKYKNVRLPLDVLQAIAKRYPNWSILKDTYHINYQYDKGITKKVYKIKIRNENDILNIKTNHEGEFI